MSNIINTDKESLFRIDPSYFMFELAREDALQYDYLLQQAQTTKGQLQDAY